MKCPHCSYKIELAHYLNWQFIPVAIYRPKEEELRCHSCGLPIYWSFFPLRVFLGTLLSLFILSKLGALQMKLPFVMPVFIFLSVLLVGILSIRLLTKPGLLDLSSKSQIQKIYFVSSFFVVGFFLYQICIFYINIIPLKANLREIDGNIIKIEKNRDGFVHSIYLKNWAPGVSFSVYGNRLSILSELNTDTRIRILADKSPNFIGTSFRVWEVTTDSQMLLPYEVMRDIRKSQGNDENIMLTKVSAVLFLLYLLALYFKRKEDLKLVRQKL